MMKRLMIPAFVLILVVMATGSALADNPPWVQVAFSEYNLADVAYDATNGYIYVAVANTDELLKIHDGVYKSTDGGANFQRVLDTSGSGISLSCLAISGNHPEVVWAGTLKNKAYRSTDYGATWVTKNVGTAFLNEMYSIQIAKTNPYVVFISGREGLFKSTDGGESFNQLAPGGLLLGTYGFGLYDGDYMKMYAGAISDSIYKSEDGGETWVSVNAGLPDGFYSKELAVDPENFDVVYSYMTKAQTKPQLWKSTDGGATWAKTEVDENLGNIDFMTSSNIAFGSIADGGIWYSSTSGAGWVVFDKGLGETEPLMKSITHLGDDLYKFYAATDQGLWYYEILSIPPAKVNKPECWENVDERNITVTWEPVTENADGSVMDDLKGYVIYRAMDTFMEDEFSPIDTVEYTGDTTGVYTDNEDLHGWHVYYYKVAAMDTLDIIGECSDYSDPVPFSVEGEGGPAAYRTALSQNSPNPFNPVTSIMFTIGGTDNVKTNLTIYDLTGKQVKVLVDEELAPGAHSVVWNGTDEAGRNVASGVYLYTLDTAGVRQTRKMVLVK